MKQWRPWVLLVLMFLAGFAAGGVASRAAVRRFVRNAVHDPNLLRDRVEWRLAGRLRLDAGQRTQAHEILLRTQGQLKELRGEFQPRFLAIMNEAQTNIAALLTAEQRQRFEKFQQENRGWWQPR